MSMLGIQGKELTNSLTPQKKLQKSQSVFSTWISFLAHS